MGYETIIVEHKEQITSIILNRPERLNSINMTMAKELNDAILKIGDSKETRVVVLRGAGRAFCAGLDLSELGKLTTLDYYQLFPVIEQITVNIPKIPQPVVGQIHSFALAGGNELALACDLVIAAEDAVFGTTAINVGGFCFTPSVLLIRHVGRKKALEMLLTGDRVNAEDALRMGLINRVIPRNEIDSAVWDLARKIAGKSPLAVQLGKKAFYTMADMEFNKAVSYVQTVNAVLNSTQDAQEGLDAFIGKRPPNWQIK